MITGPRVSNKNWKLEKKPKRLKFLNAIKMQKSWIQKKSTSQSDKIFKENLETLKNEKNKLRAEKIANLKKRRQIKLEKENAILLQKKYNEKRINRLRRKEKRNEKLKERS